MCAESLGLADGRQFFSEDYLVLEKFKISERNVKFFKRLGL
jgi:hypothetical protein